MSSPFLRLPSNKGGVHSPDSKNLYFKSRRGKSVAWATMVKLFVLQQTEASRIYEQANAHYDIMFYTMLFSPLTSCIGGMLFIVTDHI